ncbi:MAG: hypothetical protein ACYCYF_02435 [Anaerolineae bacterium]
MDSQTISMDSGGGTSAQRVVEFELHRPHREDIALPKVDIEPVRKVIEQVALTSIGLAIITARSIVRTIEAAHRAGAEAAQRPGPLTRTILDLIGHKDEGMAPLVRHSIAVLPIADYPSLGSDEVVARLTNLSSEQLEAVRAYELEHERRTVILKALDGLEATAP